MRYAVDLPAFHDFSDLHLLTRAAVEAEAAGWDGFSLWDHVNWPIDAPVPTADAWLAAAVVAAATTRIQITMWVTPLPRKLPQEVARQSTTLHRLSGGRFVLGVGSGGGGDGFDQSEFAAFGMSPDARVRGAQLDEALDVVVGLWSGEPVHHRGEHYVAEDVAFLPASPYAPGDPAIPIWVGGFWGRPVPLRRAARYDAYAPVRMEGGWTPDDLLDTRRRLAEHRPPDRPGEVSVAFAGVTQDADRGRLTELADAGLDWWSESLAPWDFSSTEVLDRISRGPTGGS